jgi:antitoxin VapB
MPSKTAKLFTNGGSQAVRLPSAFPFEGDEVLVRKNERTGDVILSTKNTRTTLAEFFSLRNSSRRALSRPVRGEVRQTHLQ